MTAASNSDSRKRAAETADTAPAETLAEVLAGITTHNGSRLSPKNLRWAATHEALARPFIFDVLMGLADALDRAVLAEGDPT